MKTYRVVAENVTTPAGWKGDEPDGRVVFFRQGEEIPRDVAKAAKSSSGVAIDALPAKSLASLLLNGFIEEIG